MKRKQTADNNPAAIENIELKIVETSDLNPSVMCTSKSKNNWRQSYFDQIV